MIYFFLRRFVAFFAAFFAFAFLFFAIAALLATISGDVGTVPSRIDVHCTPITPARRKKHRLRLTERIRNRSERLAAIEIEAARTNLSRNDRIVDQCEHKKFCVHRESIWHLAFHATRKIEFARVSTCKFTTRVAVDMPRNAAPYRFSGVKKNFSTERLRGGPPKPDSIKNARIRCK